MSRTGVRFTLKHVMYLILIAGLFAGVAVHVRNVYRDEELYAEDVLKAEAIAVGTFCVIVAYIRYMTLPALKDSRCAALLRRRVAPPDVPISDTGEVREGCD